MSEKLHQLASQIQDPTTVSKYVVEAFSVFIRHPDIESKIETVNEMAILSAFAAFLQTGGNTEDLAGMIDEFRNQLEQINDKDDDITKH